ncbi:MAG TPA: hypothetical protein VNL70_03205, partial [Tepidisphaeraceae bacterium]|nr:hypothetical protein [Tepidisphaeraceae bacterium]
LPDERWPDRLVSINPQFFELHALLGGLKRKLDLTPIHGLRFLADDPATWAEHTDKPVSAYIGSFKQIHAALAKLAEDAGVKVVRPSQVQVTSLDESGVDVRLDAQQHRTTALLLAGDLPGQQRRALGMPDGWDQQVLHRYTFLRLRGGRWIEPALGQIIVMSLDLRGTLNWGWLLPGPACVQLCVDQPISTVQELPPTQLLQHWIDVLVRHGVLRLHGSQIDPALAQSLDLPLAGALVQEGVANRTLLIGPAGGFFTACAEDIYPNCWSAVFAADVMKKALKERHLQDALQPYRHKWGATLGDYLRGPQQNLRFLLPLVYRNSTMTARLAEAILSGKSVVR